MKSFYSQNELNAIDFKSIGKNVLISRFARLYSPSTLSIGDNVRIDDFCILSGDIKLGSHIHIGAYCALYGAGGIRMCDFSGLSSRVSIYSASDDYLGGALTNPCIPDKYREIDTGIVKMEKHSLIGANSVVLPNSTLGEGAVVGAISLVKGNLSEWSIYAGIPAKRIKNRDREIIYKYEREIARQNETN